MVLAIDIGNTSAAFGCLTGSAGERTLSSKRQLSTKECGDSEAVESLFNTIGDGEGTPEGIVMSSVVPTASDMVRMAAEKLWRKTPFEIEPGIRIPLTFEGIDMTTLGHDRIVDAALAAASYKCPVMTVDLGTATTFNVIDEKGCFRGGMISVGVMTGLRALHEKTAALPLPKLAAPAHLVGQNTPSCLLSGAVIGTAAMIDGMAERVSKEMGREVTVVMTGGYGEAVSPHLAYPHHYDPHLLMKGLAFLYDLNH